MTCGCFLMSSAVHGKNWKEPQTLLKMEKVNDYEAEYDIQASVESRAEEISSNYYKDLGLGRWMQRAFGNCKKKTKAGECVACCTKAKKKCTRRIKNLKKIKETKKPRKLRKMERNEENKCVKADDFCSVKACFPEDRK